MSRLYLLLLAFTITLAAVVGWRFSSESLVVVIGVLAGVAAGIPTSLIVAWIATRVALDRYAARAPRHPPAPSASNSSLSEPRVIIIQPPSPRPDPDSQRPPASGRRPDPASAPTFAHDLPTPRRFTLVDGSSLDDD